MLDPLPPPPTFLADAVVPLAGRFDLPSLPYHIHEILGAAALYTFIQNFISPIFSRTFFKKYYEGFNARTRINWDVHVVSMFQCCLINCLALWTMFKDKERKDMTTWSDRVYGYTGMCGLIQALSAGYFIWDLGCVIRYFRIFGIGLLAHALTALSVYILGFRPFLNYYGPVFILYELSTPFLNIHWFCDKLNLTGSRIQWVNGMLLLGTFFGCRLIWGTYNSLFVYIDVWKALNMQSLSIPTLHQVSSKARPLFSQRDGELCLGDMSCVRAQAEIMRFAGPHTEPVPWWLAGIYLICNITLHTLNFFWFGRMVETVSKRFQGKPHDEYKHERERRSSIVEEMARGLEHDALSGPEETIPEEAIIVTSREEADGDVAKRR